MILTLPPQLELRWGEGSICHICEHAFLALQSFLLLLLLLFVFCFFYCPYHYPTQPSQAVQSIWLSSFRAPCPICTVKAVYRSTVSRAQT